MILVCALKGRCCNQLSHWPGLERFTDVSEIVHSEDSQVSFAISTVPNSNMEADLNKPTELSVQHSGRSLL